MEEEARNIVKDYISDESVVRNYSTVLSILVRLRQICTDLALCPADLRALLPPSQLEVCIFALLTKLVPAWTFYPFLPSLVLIEIKCEEQPSIVAKIAFSVTRWRRFRLSNLHISTMDIVITCCAHIFCESCILKTLKRTKPCCPMCRHPLSESDLFKAPPESSQTTSEGSSSRPSSKVAALLKLLSASRDACTSSKSVIFSQFRKMLLLLEEPLKEAGFKVLRLDGTMNAKRRAQVIKDFGVPVPEGPTILLASLKASSAGINLTAASTVYLLEPWWNPAVEEQAMDRVHRIGQKEDVKIVRLIARNTIEERILQLQENKRVLARKAFGRRSQKGQREISRDDLSALMNLARNSRIMKILRPFVVNVNAVAGGMEDGLLYWSCMS
ncbi:chromatin subfamily A member 3-like 1 [Sesamum angolense]|uniref:Chromatin subfamily A member 3-like 1 n=1 Tax=Sesamum angolense TaxID=2727404 RepID=A0AAE1WG21_9LAMI|nr:chromatin subfamily A member 3-like 1 [Sesamum angolense]